MQQIHPTSNDMNLPKVIAFNIFNINFRRKQPSTYWELFDKPYLNTPPVTSDEEDGKSETDDCELVPANLGTLYQNQEAHPDYPFNM